MAVQGEQQLQKHLFRRTSPGDAEAALISLGIEGVKCMVAPLHSEFQFLQYGSQRQFPFQKEQRFPCEVAFPQSVKFQRMEAVFQKGAPQTRFVSDGQRLKQRLMRKRFPCQIEKQAALRGDGQPAAVQNRLILT